MILTEDTVIFETYKEAEQCLNYFLLTNEYDQNDFNHDLAIFKIVQYPYTIIEYIKKYKVLFEEFQKINETTDN